MLPLIWAALCRVVLVVVAGHSEPLWRSSPLQEDELCRNFVDKRKKLSEACAGEFEFDENQ